MSGTSTPERDAVIITRLWGLNSEDGESLQSVATDLGLTRERIRQLSERAVQQLQSNCDVKSKDSRCDSFYGRANPCHRHADYGLIGGQVQDCRTKIIQRLPN